VSRYSIEFEAPDLAGWLWLAVAALAVVEGLRYVLAGRRPVWWPWRAALAVLVAGAVAGLKLHDWLQLDASSHGWACLWLGLLAGLWLVRSYRRTTRPVSRRLRWVLPALRLGAGLIVLLFVAQPVLRSVRIRHERAVLGIVLDDSRSMTVRDAVAPGRTRPGARLQAVHAALRENAERLDRLAEELELRWFTFDAGVQETTRVSLKGEGAFTALADAAEQAHALLGQTGRKVAGLIVVSDGRDNFSASGKAAAVAESLAAADVPLYTVGVGSEVPFGETSCLQARRLDAPARVAVMNRLPVHAEFYAAGLAGTTINVELLVGDEVVDRRELKATEARELIGVDLSHVPAEGGLYRVAVRARAESLAAEQGEAALSQFVRVVDDQIRVLYMDRARYERAAVARALEPAKELRVKKVDLNQPAQAGVSPLLPDDEAGWRPYHVVLVGDVDRRALPDAALQMMANLVKAQGCGLAFLGGLRTLGSGKYRDTPLKDLLPADLAAAGQWPGPISFELTPAGRLHPICRLSGDPETSEAIWKRLPPLTGASRLGQIPPAAEVLIRSSAGRPLLVAQETGNGRTVVIAFDSTWQWSFSGDEGAEAQRRFWRQVVLWLANRRPDVWVTTDRPRYDLGQLRAGAQQVVVRAGVVDPTTGRTPPDVTLTGTLVGPDGESQEIRWVRKSDGVEAKLSVEQAGEYRITVVGRSGEKTISQSHTAFVVESIDVELVDAVADLQTLKGMAAQTAQLGGRYVPLEHFGRLIVEIRAAGHRTTITQVRRRHLIDGHPWGWLAAFVALVTVEWVARRRAGLV